MKKILAWLLMGMALNAPAAKARAEDLAGRELLAHLRVVEDPEGSANVRSGPSIQSKVTGQLPVGMVVAVEPGPAKEWTQLWKVMDDDKPRYVHSSRLLAVGKWKQVPGRAGQGGETAVVKVDGLEVRVRAIPFEKARHKITRDPDGLELVDGQSPWGMDGGLPAQSLDLTVSLNGRKVILPASATDNLYQPNLESLVLLTPARASGQALVLMTNGDGAGAYCVVWAFRNGVYTGREVFVPF